MNILKPLSNKILYYLDTRTETPFSNRWALRMIIESIIISTILNFIPI